MYVDVADVMNQLQTFTNKSISKGFAIFALPHLDAFIYLN
jgi:hypothetical protein